LKHDLTIVTGNYRVAEVKCEQYYDLKEQVRNYKASDSSFLDTKGDKSIDDDLKH
jgi:hypothetical protein